METIVTDPVKTPRGKASVLLEAHALVHGPRQEAYSHPANDYQAVAEYFTTSINHWLRSPEGERAAMGAVVQIPALPNWLACLLMTHVKQAREIYQHKRDNLVDLAGYTECVSLIIEEGRANGR